MISYTQKNGHAARLAASIYYELRELGLNVWLDVKADDKSEAAMKHNVENAKFVIAIISDGAGVPGNAYFERKFCVSELRWARAAGTYIQPVIDVADKSRVAEFLAMAPEDLRDLGSTECARSPERAPARPPTAVRRPLTLAIFARAPASSTSTRPTATTFGSAWARSSARRCRRASSTSRQCPSAFGATSSASR